MDSMSRRAFLTRTAKAGAVLSWSAALATPFITDCRLPLAESEPQKPSDIVRIRAQSSASFTRSTAMIHQSDTWLIALSNEVARRSGGLILIERTPRGEAPDVILNATLSARRRQPAVAALANLDSPREALAHLQWLQREDVENAWSELHSGRQLYPISFGLGGSDCGLVSRKEIASLDDLRSLKSCRANHETSWLDEIGMTFMKFDHVEQIQPWLESGMIDMTPALAHSVNRHLKLARADFVYYKSPLFQNRSPYELSFRLNRWRRLELSQQAVIRQSAHALATQFLLERQRREGDALQSMQQTGLKMFASFPEEISETFASQSRSQLRMHLKADPHATSISALKVRDRVSRV